MEKILSCFPILSPPLKLSGEIASTFSSENPPIPGTLIEKYFTNWEHFDEFTEIVPCFRLETKADHHLLVYWKGSLMSYEYIILSLSKEGLVISKKIIAGTLSNNQTIKESVAYIDQDYFIYTMVGESDINSKDYNPGNSSSFRFEICPDGSIQSIQEEKSTWEEENMERKN